jgi:hypothetical protein
MRRRVPRFVWWSCLLVCLGAAAFLALTDAPPEGYNAGCDIAIVEFSGRTDELGFRDEPCVGPSRERMAFAGGLLMCSAAFGWLGKRTAGGTQP